MLYADVARSATKTKINNASANSRPSPPQEQNKLDHSVLQNGSNIVPYDGNILNFAVFLNQFKRNLPYKLNELEKFVLLLSKLNPETRPALSDIGFAGPLVFTQALARLESHFRNPYIVLPCLRYSIKTMVRLKQGYENDFWGDYIDVAQRTEQLLTGSQLGSHIGYFTRKLVKKLPLRYRNLFLSDGFDWTLQCFVQFCRDRQEYNNRHQVRPPPSGPSKQPCSLCLEEYHHAEDCDVHFTVQMRQEMVKRRRLCRRCLSRKRDHHCGRTCSRCNGDHHLAICNLITLPFGRLSILH